MPGRWAGSRRRDTLPTDWPRLRAYVLARDGHACQIRRHVCVGTATDADHIIPKHRGGTDDPANLQAACRPCHALKSSEEGNAARPRLNRPPERHPGLLDP